MLCISYITKRVLCIRVRCIKKHLSLVQGQVLTCGTTLFDIQKYIHFAECHHTLSPITLASVSATQINSFASPSEAHLLQLHLSGFHHPGFAVRSFYSLTPSSSVYSHISIAALSCQLIFLYKSITSTLCPLTDCHTPDGCQNERFRPGIFLQPPQ